jgi:copper transport protein
MREERGSGEICSPHPGRSSVHSVAGPVIPPRGRPERRATAGRRIALRCSFVLIGILLAVALCAPAAEAHAFLVRSNPASGAVLAESPGLAQLWFSEEVAPERSSARVVDAAGTSVQGIQPVAGAGDASVLVLELPPLRNGWYGLVWEAMAADDGHTTSGTVVFGVGVSAATSRVSVAASAGTASSADLSRRWLKLFALAGVIGPVAVALFVFGASARSSVPAVWVARRKLLGAAIAFGLLAILAGALDLIAEARRVAERGSASVAHLVSASRWGQLWLAHEVTLLVLVLVLVALRRRRTERARGLAVAASASLVALAWIEALGSHAAGRSSGRMLAIGTDAVHALAALLWLGAVPALLVVLWPRGELRGQRAQLVRICRGSFSLMAAGSVVLVVITGLYSAGLQVASAGSLISTGYGRTLLVKTVLLGVMGALGLMNATRLRGHRSVRPGTPIEPVTNQSRLSGLIGVEACVGVVLLVAVAVLVGQRPPANTAALDAPPTSWTGSGGIADLVVTVSATPNRPGVNWLTVLAESSRRPAPAPIEALELAISGRGGDQQLALRSLATGRYFGTYTVDEAREVRLTTIVHRAGQRYTIALPWQPDPAAGQPVATTGELAPYLNALALTVLVAAVAIGLSWLVVSRRAVPAEPPPITSAEPADLVQEGYR